MFIIRRFEIDLQKTVKPHHFAIRHQLFFARGYANFCRGLLKFRFAHLRSDGAFPYELIQPPFSVVTSDSMLIKVCWPDGFVCLLGACRFGAILATLMVLVAIS